MLMDSGEQHSFSNIPFHDQHCQLPVTLLEEGNSSHCQGATERADTSRNKGQSCKSINNFQDNFAGNTQSCNTADVSQEVSHRKNTLYLKHPQRRPPTHVHVKENEPEITDQLDYLSNSWRSTVTTTNSLQVGHHMALQNRKLAEIDRSAGLNTHEYKYVSNVPLSKTLDETGKPSLHRESLHQDYMNPYVGAGNPYSAMHATGNMHITSSHVTESTTLKHSQINPSMTRVLPDTVYSYDGGWTVGQQNYPDCDDGNIDVQETQEVVNMKGQVFYQQKEIVCSQEGKMLNESRKRTDAFRVPPSSFKGRNTK